MFKRSIFLSVIIIGYVSFSHAQLEKDSKATSILKGVSDKYKSFGTISSDFLITIEDTKTKSKETQAGSISIKAAMYLLTLADQQVISDGKTVWTYLNEANEVQINNAGAKPGSITPNNIFTLYEHGFGSRYMGEKTISGKVYQLIDLVPDDTKKSYFKVQLQVNKADKQVSGAKVFQKNGTFLTYSIVKFKPNPNLPDSLFIFNKNKFPGVEVIDLR